MCQPTLRERFEAKAVIAETGCWEWTGQVSKTDGYARIDIRRDGRRQPTVAHRVAYELLHGPISPGLSIDHLCRNRGCVNPTHLEAVPQRINFLRGMHPSAVAVRTNRCKHGHEFTPENTASRTTGSRDCRTCMKRRDDARPRKTQPRTLRQRFEDMAFEQDDGCWGWRGAHLRNGYPVIRVKRQTTLARRIGYQLFVGPIPEGRQLRRCCSNVGCVNPQHLRLR